MAAVVIGDGPDPAPPWDPGLVELYRTHYGPMVRLAYLLTGDGAVAEEVVQDSFVNVHRAWARANHPPAYLRTAVVNACRSWGRRKALERSRPPDGPGLVAASGDELWDVLRALPDRQRAAIVLRFYDDLPDAEIAGILGCRTATVRTAIHRGLAAMRKEIEP